MKPELSHTNRHESSKSGVKIVKIVLIYALLSMIYILFSDALVSRLFATPESISIASTLKGWLFVLVTSLLLYLLMTRLVGQIASTTQRSQALQADRIRTLRLLNSITENSSDAIFIKDLEGRYLVVNPALAKLLGKPMEKIIGQNDFQLFPDHLAQAYREDDRVILESGETRTFHESLITGEQTLPYLTTKGPLIIEGKIEGVFGIARDISQLKQAEDEIREGLRSIQAQEVELQALFQALPDIYFRMAPDGTVLDYRTQNIAELYAKPETFLGRPIGDVLPEYLADLLNERIRQACQTEEMQVFEYDLAVAGVEHHYEARLILLPDKEQLILIIRNISVQYRARQELVLSEQRFRSFFEQAAVGVALIDSRTGRILRINQCYCDIVGYSSEEMTSGKTFRQITHPQDHQRDENNLHLMLAGEVSQFEMEKRYIHRDGSIIWCNLTVSPTWQSGEEPTNHIAVAVDITKRKQAEAALQESEEQLRTLINATPDIICFKDGEGRWLQANDADLELFALTGVDYRGKTDSELADFTAPMYRNAFLACEESDEKAWQHGATLRCEEAIPRMDGTTAIYDVIKVPLRGDDGSRHGLIILGRDITDRKRVEQQLALANAEWTQAMDQFDDSVYLLDTQLRLLKANRAFYEMAGLEPEQSLGQTITDLMHPDGGAGACPICSKLIAGEECVFTLDEDDTLNPDEKPIEVKIKQLHDKSGDSTGMLISLHDLSHSRKIEERLRLAASVFENTDEGVIITDPSARILDVNKAFTRIQGYTRDEVIGQNPRIFKSGHHDQSFYRDMWRTLTETGHWRGEMWNRRKNGELFPKWQTINQVLDANGNLTHYVGIFADITHIKQSQEKLDHLGHHDALTDLPNRLLLNERLEQAVKHAERHNSLLAVIFLDLDNFKHINDSLGHPVGDQLLQAVSRKLLEATRQDDTVARIGVRRVRAATGRYRQAGERRHRGGEADRHIYPAVPAGRALHSYHGQSRYLYLPTGWRRPQHPVAQRRLGHVPGQGGGAQHLPVLHRRADPQRLRTGAAGKQPAPGN